MSRFYRVDILGQFTRLGDVKDSFGLTALDICLDPDRWLSDFYCLEEYGDFLWLCWLSVWDEFIKQSYIPPRVIASLFVLSRRLLFFRDFSLSSAMPMV